MKIHTKLFSALTLMLGLTGAFSAQAQTACDGEFVGRWDGNGRPIRVIAQSNYNGQLRVTVIGNDTEVTYGNCYGNYNGGRMVFSNGHIRGDLTVDGGGIYGVLNGYRYNGRRTGGGGYPPPGPPMPPPGYRDLCNGEISGTWYYKEGRWMTISLQRQGRENVRVVINQQNGRDISDGTCYQDGRGAQVRIDGRETNGRLSISPSGDVRGEVGGVAFSGRMR